MRAIFLLIVSLWSCLQPIDCICGYDACHKTDPNKLNIHLIAHSHDDVGWLRTADQYYDSQVRHIITSVVQSLQDNHERRFTQVEVYYFHRWWRQQTPETRDVVTKLVQNGQLVFTNGGWTINDEGCAHYNNIIDQLTLGLKFLNETFGACGQPRVSWQIDPFGASREMASLYALMAYDGHVVNRGPLPKGEYVWKASDDLNTRIFTTVLHDMYVPPKGFDFEKSINFLNDANQNDKADDFVKIARGWDHDYGNTNQLLMTMGSDFNYEIAENWFSNMDRLIEVVRRRHKDVDVFYSTPDCYIKAMNSMNRTFPERTVDYFSYWVGYYSNRPALKYQDRITNNILQASKQLDVIARLDPSRSQVHLAEARNQVAVLTHHDAITGTSPQATADDYTQRLQSGFAAAKVVIKKAYHHLIDKQNSTSAEFCDCLNITACHSTETNDKIAVIVYNPIARPIEHYLQIPVIDTNYKVFDSVGQVVSRTSVFAVSDAVKHLPERHSNATHELVFKSQVPALGFTTYFIEKQKTDLLQNQLVGDKRATEDLRGKSFSVQIDETSGALKTITLNGKTHKLRQKFQWYKSMAFHPGMEDSGGYNFCPDGAAHDYEQSKLISRHTSGGVHELQQQFSDYVKQTVRTYEDEDYIEFDWTVGPIPVDEAGKEIITRFESDIANDNVFYTDANGRQTIRRVFNGSLKGCDGNWDGNGYPNWFPIYSRVHIKDEKQSLQMTVLTDRTQGGSSIIEGEIELMVHRRLTRYGLGSTDAFIIDELGVDGKGLIVRGKHYLFFQAIDRSAQLAKSLSQSLFMAPILTFDNYSTIKEYSSRKEVSFSGLSQSLPENIHLLTLENFGANRVLLRLENRNESSDNKDSAKPVDIDLNGIFKTFKVLSVEETTLTANQWLSSSKRLQWNSHSDDRIVERTKRASDSVVRINPQEIRTFILSVEDNTHKEEKCTHSWVKATLATIPKNALVAGYDRHNEPLNICRQMVNNKEVIAGRVDKADGCLTTFGGKQVKNSSFDVLVANNVEWVSRHGTDPMPEHSLVVNNETSGQTFVGRCYVRNEWLIGKIDYNFFYGFGGKEYSDCENHEVLVCIS